MNKKGKSEGVQVHGGLEKGIEYLCLGGLGEEGDSGNCREGRHDDFRPLEFFRAQGSVFLIFTFLMIPSLFCQWGGYTSSQGEKNKNSESSGNLASNSHYLSRSWP